MFSTLLKYLSLAVGCATLANAALPGFPPKIYGTNIGSWLLVEPWMLPAEWVSMGGQQCDDCSTCIASEFAFVKAYPTTADAKFKKHWETWFTKSDIQQLKDVGINTVRVPLGYWIVEPLVNRATEFYPKGGILELQRGLADLKAAGITVILDHHALPGVSSPGQMFAGRCTNDVQFYTPSNYHRALIWAAVMTAVSHTDPNFATVASIEAINEPIMDASKTPGLGDYYKNFVQTVRSVEALLGIGFGSKDAFTSFANITQAFNSPGQFTPNVSDEVAKVLQDAMPIIVQVAAQLKLNLTFKSLAPHLAARQPLVTNLMDVNWQWNNPANPADAADGPQGYDNHLYYSFGGVADPNETAYLTNVCNLDRIANDAARGNSPLWFGEWGLSTQFSATDAFLRKWADAQKFSYSKDAGWIFWNFKIEISTLAGDTARQWSYLEGVKRGYLTKDPSKYNDPHVCDSYIKTTTS